MSNDKHHHEPVHAQDENGGLYAPAPPKKAGGKMQTSRWPKIGQIIWVVVAVLVIIGMFVWSFSILNDPLDRGRYTPTTNDHSNWARLVFFIVAIVAFVSGLLSAFKRGSRKMALLALVVLGVAAWMIYLLIPLTETTGHFGG